MRRYAAIFDTHRLPAALLMAAMTIAALIGLSRLQVNEQVRDLFRTNAGTLEELEDIYADFGADDMDVYIVVSADDVYTGASRAAMHELIADLRALDEVADVRSLGDLMGFDADGRGIPLLPDSEASADEVAAARDLALKHPIAAGRLINDDGSAAMLIARLRWPMPAIAPDAEYDLMAPVDAVIRQADAGEAIGVTSTGLLPVRNEMLRTLKREMAIFVGISAAIGAAIALVLFRRVSAVVIITTANALAALWTLGLMGLAGEMINPVNSVVATLVMIIAFTDSVHIMHHIRKELVDGATPREAAIRAITMVGPACALTSLTTAIGFASLITADVDVIRRFGIVAAIGSLMAFAAVVTVVPLLTGFPLIGSWLTPRAGKERLWKRSYRETALGRVSAFVLRHARIASVLGVLVTVGFAWTAMQLRPTSFLREGIPASSESAEAVGLIDEQFGGLLSLIVLVEWDDDAALDEPAALLPILEQIETLLRDANDVHAPLSLHALVQALPGDSQTQRLAMLGFVPESVRGHLHQPDVNRALVVAFMADNGSHLHTPVLEALHQQIAALERQLQQDGIGISLSLNGTPVAIGQAANLMIRDLLTSLALASVVIFGVMTIAFRSLRLGLIGLLPNAFPLFAAASFLVLIDQPLTVTGVITFCVCLGIAVDDTIHVVTRYRQRTRKGDSPHDALHHTMVTVGSALLTTTAVLVGGLGALLFSSMPLVQLFGMIASVGLAAAYIGDVLVLPALIAWSERKSTIAN